MITYQEWHKSYYNELGDNYDSELEGEAVWEFKEKQIRNQAAEIEALRGFSKNIIKNCSNLGLIEHRA